MRVAVTGRGITLDSIKKFCIRWNVVKREKSINAPRANEFRWDFMGESRTETSIMIESMYIHGGHKVGGLTIIY